MYKYIAILMMCLILGFFSLGFGQGIAEISYITNKGTAYLLSNPGVKLVNRQELQASDSIVLGKGAGVRIFYPDLQIGVKYEAPDTVSISEEIQNLSKKSESTNKIEKAISEIGRFIRQYLNPIYNRYAGTRGIQIVKSAVVHDHTNTFRQQPHIVLRGVGESQEVGIYSSKNIKLTQMSVDAGRGILAVPVKNAVLDYNQTYTWKVSGEKQAGEIKVVTKKEASEIETVIQELERESLDAIEAAQSIAAWLFDQGYWAEAYVYAQKGLAVDSENSVLINLQQAILNLRPEDTAFQNAIEKSGELSLRYSFHIKKGNRLQEIYTGSTVQSGDMMQIRLKASNDCYLFILNIDAANKLYVLYPLENQDHFLQGGKEIVFPEPGKYFQADDQVGQEKLYLIAAKVPLDYLAVELDKYFAAPSSGTRGFTATRGLTDIRGFSKIVDEQGEPVHDITEGLESFKLSRLLKGKGLVVKEIGFVHVK